MVIWSTRQHHRREHGRSTAYIGLRVRRGQLPGPCRRAIAQIQGVAQSWYGREDEPLIEDQAEHLVLRFEAVRFLLRTAISAVWAQHLASHHTYLVGWCKMDALLDSMLLELAAVDRDQAEESLVHLGGLVIPIFPGSAPKP